MAFLSHPTRPVTFGHAPSFEMQQPPTAYADQPEPNIGMPWTGQFRPVNRNSVKDQRFLDNRPRTMSPAYAHQHEWPTVSGGARSATAARPALVSPEQRRGPRIKTGTRSVIDGTASSSRGGCGQRSATTATDSGTSECSSMAPYWMPEQIRHYFRHQHSAAGGSGGTGSSDKTDAALRDIGRERELSTMNSNWSRWSTKCCRTPRHALVTVMAVAVGVLLALLLATVVAEFHGTLPGSRLKGPAAGVSRGEGTAGVPDAVVHKKHGAVQMTTLRDEKKHEDAEGDDDQGAMGETAAGSTTEQEEVTASDNDEVLSEGDRSDVVSGFRANFSGKPQKPTCGQPVFKFCSGGSPEFYYDEASHACVQIGSDGPGICNRGRNRFVSLERCRRQCVDSQAAGPQCYQRALFAQCQSRDVITTWWWYKEGEGCRRWVFPHGRCPSRGGTDVFRTSEACVRRCVRPKRRKPCRVPTAAPCEAKHLRFGYFADAHSSRDRRCRQLPPGGRCLVGANRFQTKAACRKACLRAVP